MVVPRCRQSAREFGLSESLNAFSFAQGPEIHPRLAKTKTGVKRVVKGGVKAFTRTDERRSKWFPRNEGTQGSRAVQKLIISTVALSEELSVIEESGAVQKLIWRVANELKGQLTAAGPVQKRNAQSGTRRNALKRRDVRARETQCPCWRRQCTRQVELRRLARIRLQKATEKLRAFDSGWSVFSDASKRRSATAGFRSPVAETLVRARSTEPKRTRTQRTAGSCQRQRQRIHREEETADERRRTPIGTDHCDVEKANSGYLVAR